MNVKETMFSLTHPKDILGAKLRQIDVSLELASPPVGIAIEDFLELSATQAAVLIRDLEQLEKISPITERGGVQLEDWPRDDQERMLRGELPKGVPLHRNV
jgi:hypothetical protein